MKIEVAKTAGFCFGVDRAVTLCYEKIANGEQVCTYGPLIHNPQVIQDLQSKGMRIIQNAQEARVGETVIIRTHGVEQAVMRALQDGGASVCDATCPFVKKIHTIVAEKIPPQAVVLIAGDSRHPEVIGIMGHCRGACLPFTDAKELEQALLREKSKIDEFGLALVSQTTFSVKEWEKCLKIVNKHYTNAQVFDTICNATQDRQSEALALSRRCDCMLIIGGRESSNTAKLKAVCEENCPSFLIEDASELDALDLSGCSVLGVTAGASTPAGIIKEVLLKMSENENEIFAPQETAPVESAAAEESVEAVVNAPSEEDAGESAVQAAAEPVQMTEEVPPIPREITDDMDFTEALEVSLNSMNSDQMVRGIVMRVSPSEIQVDIGRKQTGYVPVSEYSADPAANPAAELKIGDEMNLIIMKTNDMEGTVMLSKRRYDAMQAWTDVVEAETSGEILEGIVTDVIRGGVLVLCRGVKIFVPASLATMNRNDPLEDLLRKEVKFRIIEVNRSRRRAVGSIRAVMKDLRKEATDKFWDGAQVGQTYQGKVRSMTSYGAFVDVGGVDGMVHISELSWKRIKHPSDVLNIGDEVEVYIKALDPEAKRISLGYKKAEDNPWELLKRDYPVDSVVEVEVVSMTTFGAFARIIPGIDGLIHISQIADRHIEKPQDELKVGDKVQAKITAIDFDKKRVSLSIRALLDPMEKNEEAEATEE